MASAIEPADGAPYAPTPQLTQSRNLDVEREETELEPALLKHHADAFGWALACCELDRLCCSSQRVAPEKTSYGPRQPAAGDLETRRSRCGAVLRRNHRFRGSWRQ